MIISEVKRLYSLFDLDGKQIDENKSTIPVI